MEIIDMTKDPKGRPIELLYALQASTHGGTPFFHLSKFEIDRATASKVIRVGYFKIDSKEFDLIVVRYRHGDLESMSVFLGHWNDGVI